MIITTIVAAATAGIGGLAVGIRSRYKRKIERLSALGRRMEIALIGMGLDAALYPDTHRPDAARMGEVGKLQIFRGGFHRACGHCGFRNNLELHYVVSTPTSCGAKRLFVGDCCHVCQRFVPPKPDGEKAALAERPEGWLKFLDETVHIEDLITFIEHQAVKPDIASLEAQEAELEARLNEARLRLQAAREAQGQLTGMPFRPQLAAENG